MMKIVHQSVDDDLKQFAGIKGFESQLAEKAKQVDIDTINNLKLPEMIKKPSGFSFPVPLNIYKKADGTIELKDFNIEKFHPVNNATGKAYYVSRSDGADANDGLTRKTALKIYSWVSSKPDVDIIYVAGGNYVRSEGICNPLPARNLKIIAYNGEEVVFSNIGKGGGTPFVELTWTLYSTGVYSTPRTSVQGVYDSKILDEYNNYKKYVNKTTLADCQATAGSWYTDGTTLYVHTVDGNMPLGDSDIKVVWPGSIYNPNATNTYYFEGITFDMADETAHFVNADTLLFKNCTFKNACVGGGLHIEGASLVILQDCKAYGNFGDGISFANCNFLELNSKSYGNGLDNLSSTTTNGSTSHSTTKASNGVRINGMYFENNGPNVADVQATGFTNNVWNIGCVAYNSKVTADGYKWDFQTTDKQWLDSCISYGTQYGVSAVSGTGAAISYLRHCKINNAIYGTNQNY
jgi:hypothetical protein